MNLLIELNNFHEEVLYGEYINNLELNINSYILTTKVNFKNGLFDSIDPKYKIELYNSTSFISVINQINGIIKSHNINTITLITCERKFEILTYLFLKIRNHKILFNRFSHNIPINIFLLLKKPLELLTILVSNRNYFIDNRVNISLLPKKFEYREVFYGKFKDVLKLNIPKNFVINSDDVYIVVIGTISYKRRNYLSLITEVKKIKNKNVKFILLTNYNSDDGIDFYNKIIENDLFDRFIFFNYYLNYSEFCKIIDISHASALLFDDSVLLIQDYLNNKVSSAVKFSEEFKKTILSSNDFTLKLNSKVIYYNSTFISEGINILF